MPPLPLLETGRCSGLLPGNTSSVSVRRRARDTGTRECMMRLALLQLLLQHGAGRAPSRCKGLARGLQALQGASAGVVELKQVKQQCATITGGRDSTGRLRSRGANACCSPALSQAAAPSTQQPRPPGRSHAYRSGLERHEDQKRCAGGGSKEDERGAAGGAGCQVMCVRGFACKSKSHTICQGSHSHSQAGATRGR